MDGSQCATHLFDPDRPLSQLFDPTLNTCAHLADLPQGAFNPPLERRIRCVYLVEHRLERGEKVGCMRARAGSLVRHFVVRASAPQVSLPKARQARAEEIAAHRESEARLRRTSSRP